MDMNPSGASLLEVLIARTAVSCVQIKGFGKPVEPEVWLKFQLDNINPWSGRLVSYMMKNGVERDQSSGLSGGYPGCTSLNNSSMHEIVVNWQGLNAS